jgi:hypothetical protein
MIIEIMQSAPTTSSTLTVLSTYVPFSRSGRVCLALMPFGNSRL